jgi:DNA repair protein RecO (recombination protein O)
MRQISTEGIILRKNNFAENDQYVTIFSPQLGKIDAIAKGARKINSPYIGHLEILNISKFQLYKNNQSYTITQCQVRQSYKLIREDFEKSIMAILLAEIFHKTTLGHEHNRHLFNLIEESLNHLCNSKNHALCLESFKIKLLDRLGILPEVENCAVCGKRWQTEETVLIGSDGHITCQECRLPNYNYRIIPFNIIKLINFIGLSSFNDIESITLKSEEHNTLKRFGDLFLKNFIGREIISEKIMNSI